MKIRLGGVAHFSITVRDLDAAAKWWQLLFDLEVYQRTPRRIILGNDAVLIGLIEGEPRQTDSEHLAFHVDDRSTLEAARHIMHANGVQLEDVGNEIGPVAPGSKSLGLWFYDSEGHRWELYLHAGAA